MNNILGSAGDDSLEGISGPDNIIGFGGDDTYILESNDDIVIEQKDEGLDLVKVLIATPDGSYILPANIEESTLYSAVAFNLTGNNLDNTLTGNAFANTLDGAAGIDTLIGGAGDDTYIVDNAGDIVTEQLNEGTDLVQVGITTAGGTYALTDNVENGTLTNAVSYNLTGNALNNTLTGNSSANTLDGGSGDDTLDGGAGIDTLIGGEGDDTYIVDLTTTGALQDTITEIALATNNDKVQLRGSYTNTTAATLTLAANLEHLDASATATSLINLTGNTANNELTGNAANNILNGLAGADTMTGGEGNDTYVVDNLNDLVVELANEGVDLVQVGNNTSRGTYTLGDNLENAIITNKIAFNLTGNELDNNLVGNASSNILIGGDGDDTLDGLAGADAMEGGMGDDVYVVDNIRDTILELSGQGIDTVRSFINYSLAIRGNENIENLTLSGVKTIDATGNDLDNILIGNSAANAINGGEGNDTIDGGNGRDRLIGGLGDDIYIVDINTATGVLQDSLREVSNAGTDTIQLRGSHTGTVAGITLAYHFENLDISGTFSSLYNLTGNAANNQLTGNAANNVLNGGAGNDTLIGGLGNDTLAGGLGADVFVFNTALNGTTNRDTITDFLSGTDKINLENAIMTGLGLTTGQLTLDQFRSGAGISTAGDSSDRVIHNTTTGGLFYDADGNGSGDAVLFAILGANLQITHQDFWIV
jgi:Ca2+-binding RTX toxin-like protein